MVQFRPTQLWQIKWRRDYWMLGHPTWRELSSSRLSQKEQLQQAGWKGEIPRSKKRRQELVARGQRRLMFYEFCLTEELLGFCVQRGLKTEGKDQELIRRLEQADDETTSSGFMKLPEELRQAIFSLHYSALETIGDGGKGSKIRAPPPITQVCRKLRQEAFSLFYESNNPTFVIETRKRTFEDPSDYTGFRPPDSYLITDRYLANLPGAILWALRTFTIEATVALPSGIQNASFRWKVEILPGGERYQVWFEAEVGRVILRGDNLLRVGWAPRGADKEIAEKAEAKMEKSLKTMWKDGGFEGGPKAFVEALEESMVW